MDAEPLRIKLPHKWSPRSYQSEVLSAISQGFKRIILRWHRQAGKDALLWNATIREICLHGGIAHYVLPDLQDV